MSVHPPTVGQLQLVMNHPTSSNLLQRCSQSALCACQLAEYYFYNFYRYTVHYGIYILFTHQQMHFLLKLEKFKST